jgi:DNA-binding CsgD family transcriptional regulator
MQTPARLGQPAASERTLKAKFAFRAGVAVYALASAGFLIELTGEITGVYLIRYSWLMHEIVELATFAGLATGALMLWHSNRRLRERNSEVEGHLRTARGEFQAMTQLQFQRWGLSPAECDVALLTIKGMSVSEIAALRDTSVGTVKSQNSAIYRKAGVKTRTQLVGALIEELLVSDTA